MPDCSVTQLYYVTYEDLERLEGHLAEYKNASSQNLSIHEYRRLSVRSAKFTLRTEKAMASISKSVPEAENGEGSNFEEVFKE